MKIPSSLILLFSFAIILGIFHTAIGQEDQSSMVLPNDKKDIYIPKDLNEALIELNRILPTKTQQEFMASNENEIAKYHFNVGMWLRNYWGLWKGSRLREYFENIGIYHPDDMSGILLHSYWRKVNKRPIQLENQIKYYKEYWLYTIPSEKANSPADGSIIHFIVSKPCKDLSISEHCQVHLGVSESDGSPWAYAYGKGVYEPSIKEKEEVLKHSKNLKIN